MFVCIYVSVCLVISMCSPVSLCVYVHNNFFIGGYVHACMCGPCAEHEIRVKTHKLLVHMSALDKNFSDN